MRGLLLSVLLLATVPAMGTQYANYTCHYVKPAGGEWTLESAIFSNYYTDIGFNEEHVSSHWEMGRTQDNYYGGGGAELMSEGTRRQFVVTWIDGDHLDLGFGGCLFTGTVHATTEVGGWDGKDSYFVSKHRFTAPTGEITDMMMMVGMKSNLDPKVPCDEVFKEQMGDLPSHADQLSGLVFKRRR